MKKQFLSLFLPLIVVIALGLSLSSCKDTLDMPIEEALKYNPKDDPYMEVCKHVSNVSKDIVVFFEKCSSIDELCSYLDEMKTVEYVEDIYFTNITMFVKIKDFGTISYSYFPDPEENYGQEETKFCTPSLTRASDASYGHSSLKLGKAAIINQAYNDESRNFCRNISEAICSFLDDAGFVSVPINSPKYEFFQKEIFTYDMVFLMTHGVWDSETQLHWLVTSTEVSEEDYNFINENKLYQYKDIPRDQVTVTSIRERRKNDEGKVNYKTIYYIKVSEKFIEESNLQFEKSGSVIFFNGACQSVMGGKRDGTDTNERNFSLADILKRKGVGFYLGYDEADDTSHYAMLQFCGRLVSGMSLEMAYTTLPDKYLHNGGSYLWKKSIINPVIVKYVADLLPYPIDYSSNASATISCPWLRDYKDNSTNQSISVTIQATSRYYNNLLKDYGELNQNYKISTDDLCWGFEICESSDFTPNSNLTRTNALPENCTYENNRFNYAVNLTNNDLKAGTTYYYRAYFFDGKYYNYSDIDSFTTPKIESNNTGNTAQTQDVPGTDL